MKKVIYGLYSSLDVEKKIRYVGYTGNGLKRRIYEHVSEAEKFASKNVHRFNWIRSVIANGGTIEGVELEEVNEQNWQERERHWISFHGRNNLVNSTDGGEGLVNPSQEIREGISAKVAASLAGNKRRKGILHSEEHKTKIGIGVASSAKFRAACEKKKGISPWSRLTEEQKEAAKKKISESKKGIKRKPFTAEAIENMRKAQIGRKLTAEARAKIAEANKGNKRFLGKKHSEESKRKMSESKKSNKNALGMRQTEEARAKIAEANKGNKRALGLKQSEESINKIKEARKGGKFINDGEQTKFLKAGEQIPAGWKFGILKRK